MRRPSSDSALSEELALDEGGPEASDAQAPFCPVARALDLIGERWVLVLLHHLLGGPRGFSELRERTGIAPRVLSTRLRQLVERGFVEQVQVKNRFQYAITARGSHLAPIVREIARWWVVHEMEHAGPYRDTSPATMVESLPFMLREDRARGAHVIYEVRLTGAFGGVWTIEIDDGVCRVSEGFAPQADVRYTADARDWCRLSLGRIHDREAIESGRLKKDGSGGSLAWYFHQPRASAASAGDEREDGAEQEKEGGNS